MAGELMARELMARELMARELMAGETTPEALATRMSGAEFRAFRSRRPGVADQLQRRRGGLASRTTQRASISRLTDCDQPSREPCKSLSGAWARDGEAWNVACFRGQAVRMPDMGGFKPPVPVAPTT